MWWIADKVAYRDRDDFVRAYWGDNMVWDKYSNRIVYTTSDGQIIDPYINYGTGNYGFGANIVSNTYSNGFGVIIFDGPVKRIGIDTFSNEDTLTSIVIPPSVTSIKSAAFDQSDNLSSVDIPSSVTSIERGAFFGCDSLGSITIPSSVTSLGLEVFYGSGLNSITIPSSITSLSARTFFGCNNLNMVTIPSSVTSIGTECFAKCPRLSSITIPSSVTSIGNQCFAFSSTLWDITIDATTPPTLGTNVFYNIDNPFFIRVPAASLQAYKTAPGWSDYASSIVAQ